MKTAIRPPKKVIAALKLYFSAPRGIFTHYQRKTQ